MNDLCNTFTRLNCKFGGIQKTKKILIIVCSNYTIDECYSKAVDQRADITETVHARFRELKFMGKDFNDEGPPILSVIAKRARSPLEVGEQQHAPPIPSDMYKNVKF